MKYIVRIPTLDITPEIEISSSEFEQIRNARSILSNALAIEEKYELLLSNYLELEKELLNISCEFMVKGDLSYTNFFDIQLTFNRRIVNLLTSTKLYIDQIKQHIKLCLTDKNSADKILALFSTEYNSHFEYRFMEALRNYVQHKGLAIHNIRFGSEELSTGDTQEDEYKITVSALKSKINSDAVFKKSVSNEMPDKVDLIYSTRVYVESISKIHYQIRQQITNICESSRTYLSTYIDKYAELNNHKTVGLEAVCLEQQNHFNQTIEQVNMMLDWDDVRIGLINKNKHLVNLRKKFVSSRTHRK
jgi:hypothetical protein